MSILIKGMKMPKNCKECELLTVCSACEGYSDTCPFEPSDVETDWDIWENRIPSERPKWCPLIEIREEGESYDN